MQPTDSHLDVQTGPLNRPALPPGPGLRSWWRAQSSTPPMCPHAGPWAHFRAGRLFAAWKSPFHLVDLVRHGQVGLFHPIPIWWMRRTETTANEKAGVVDHPQGFDHVGLLVNEPPGQAGLPFIQSSDDTFPMIPLEPSMFARHLFTIDYPPRDKNSKRIIFLCSMLACKGKNMSSRIVRM